MSTTSASAPEVTVYESAAVKKVVQAFNTTQAKLAVQFDAIRNTAKTEAVKNGWNDKKKLTALLLDLGLDAARTSEVVGFVFPAHSAARAELDKAMEINSKVTDQKERIAKPVILALQRDKEGTLTLEKAIEQHKAATTAGRAARTPEANAGTAATPPQVASVQKTPKQIEDELGNLFAAALAFGKKHDYDAADCAAVFEEWSSKVFPETEASEEGEGEGEGEETAE